MKTNITGAAKVNKRVKPPSRGFRAAVCSRQKRRKIETKGRWERKDGNMPKLLIHSQCRFQFVATELAANLMYAWISMNKDGRNCCYKGDESRSRRSFFMLQVISLKENATAARERLPPPFLTLCMHAAPPTWVQKIKKERVRIKQSICLRAECKHKIVNIWILDSPNGRWAAASAHNLGCWSHFRATWIVHCMLPLVAYPNSAFISRRCFLLLAAKWDSKREHLMSARLLHIAQFIAIWSQ
jgi:hypothetical protein